MSVTTERFHGLDFLRASNAYGRRVKEAPMLYYMPIMADGFQDFGVSRAQAAPRNGTMD